MGTPFENSINIELPLRPSADFPMGGSFAAGLFMKTTGVGMKTVPAVVLLRASSTGDTGSLTIDSDSYDQYAVTALVQSITINNPTGTPVDGQRLNIRIKSAASQAISYGGQFRGSVDLPLDVATSGGSKTDYMGFVWNAADSKWDYIASNWGF